MAAEAGGRSCCLFSAGLFALPHHLGGSIDLFAPEDMEYAQRLLAAGIAVDPHQPPIPLQSSLRRNLLLRTSSLSSPSFSSL
jgi:hypothetical protein